ncbi:MAG: radical SAM family heme chaperone HemW [Desulfobacterales bacterium]|nr:radical SAM family heme chaperone HemW [Desulfobacterales bacterium]
MAIDFLDKPAWPAEPAGLYIHIPFCIRKCPYCDFYSVTDLSLKKSFIKALAQEMRFYAGHAVRVDTLYIGGGTPSVLNTGEIERIVTEARRCFNVLPEAELTLEVNPGTVTARSLSDYRRCGVNRINIGVQSFQNRILGFLQRIHTAEDASNSIRWARRAGFNNIGLDLIYGVSGQTDASWRADLRAAVSFKPEHLSCYMLTYEKGTPLALSLGQGLIKPMPERRVAKLFIETVEWLAQNGYVQYEISNFTRAGANGTGLYPSGHNQKYWNFSPYLGLGPSAHSFLEPVRFWNLRSVRRYIERLNAGKPAMEDKETLTIGQQMMETVFLGLRTVEGIPMDRFNEKFKLNFLEMFTAVLSELEEEGLLRADKNRCVLTRDGMLLLDSIVDRMVRFVQEQN